MIIEIWSSYWTSITQVKEKYNILSMLVTIKFLLFRLRFFNILSYSNYVCWLLPYVEVLAIPIRFLFFFYINCFEGTMFLVFEVQELTMSFHILINHREKMMVLKWVLKISPTPFPKKNYSLHRHYTAFFNFGDMASASG